MIATPDPTAAGFDAERLERITAHLNRRYIEPGKIVGCQTLVARKGHVGYFSSLGDMDRERERPMQDDTIFRIYSMSKPITSVALMMLFEEGEFQLNDPVHRVVPEWRDMKVIAGGSAHEPIVNDPQGPMTFRDLLMHTSGLTYGGDQREIVDQLYREAGLTNRQDFTLKEFVQRLAGIPLKFSPGTRWHYSYSTDICGYLVEAISGQPFDVFLKERIFDPLGMDDTAFHVASNNQSRFAANYQRERDKSLKLIDDPEASPYLTPPKFQSGGGGLTSTTADYYRFCQMLLNGGELDGVRLLGSRTIDLMSRNHLPDGQDLAGMALGAFSETAYEGVGFGLGFAMSLDEVSAGGLGAGDYYWGGAASTIFWVDPKEQLICIFMTQLMPSATFNFRGQLKSIIYSSIVD